MDFVQHVGQGLGRDWRGIIFRRSYPELSEIVHRTYKLFHQQMISPNARYNAQEHVWRFPDGEQLILSYMADPSDYYKHHGHEVQWVGWEELTTWPTDECYISLFSCVRSDNEKVPLKIRSNTNPYGVGHNWVKARFVDPMPCGQVYTDPNSGHQRVRIRGHWTENKALLNADPEYPKRLMEITDPAKRKAWMDEDWDVTSGGMFDDLWDRNIHVLPRFPIPATWRVDRSFDWGGSRPFSVCWFAETDGELVNINGESRYLHPGTVILIDEWYGCQKGRPDKGINLTNKQIAEGIKKRERQMKYGYIYPGPADPSIWADAGGHCIAKEMSSAGVRWKRYERTRQSRKPGWQIVRERLAESRKQPMEAPGFFVFDNCLEFLRTFPVAPRSESDPDDIDPKSESHICDAIRYRLATKRLMLSATERI